MQNFGAEPVTQQEASAMVELWTQRAETSLDLRDVVEALHISEAEGYRLLQQVRRKTSRPSPSWKFLASVFLGLVLGYSMMLAGVAAYLSLAEWGRGRADTANFAIATASITWLFVWATYFRRQIGRGLSGLGHGLTTFGRRLIQGKA